MQRVQLARQITDRSVFALRHRANITEHSLNQSHVSRLYRSTHSAAYKANEEEISLWALQRDRDKIKRASLKTERDRERNERMWGNDCTGRRRRQRGKRKLKDHDDRVYYYYILKDDNRKKREGKQRGWDLQRQAGVRQKGCRKKERNTGRKRNKEGGRKGAK